MNLKPGTLCIIVNCIGLLAANNGTTVEIVSGPDGRNFYGVKSQSPIYAWDLELDRVSWVNSCWIDRECLLPINDPGLDVSGTDELPSPVSEETANDTCLA